MEFYSADIEMLMSGWNTLYHDKDVSNSQLSPLCPIGTGKNHFNILCIFRLRRVISRNVQCRELGRI
jgi:hypothetical protein